MCTMKYIFVQVFINLPQQLSLKYFLLLKKFCLRQIRYKNNQNKKIAMQLCVYEVEREYWISS